MTITSATKGGAWLLEPSHPESVMTPERLPDELRLIAQTAHEFATKEVIPQIDRLERKDWARSRQLLRRAGELGLLGVDVPEEYGGVGLDKTAALVVSSHLAGSASFSATFSVGTYETQEYQVGMYGGGCTTGCGGSYQTTFEVTGEWQEVTVPFCSLTRVGAAVSLPLATAKISALGWSIPREVDFDFYIDDVTFY